MSKKKVTDNEPAEQFEVMKFTDEDGNVYEFEVLDTIEFDSREFVVLYPKFEQPAETEGMVHIYEVVEELDSDTDTYIGIDDQSLIDSVYAEFMKLHGDDFNFSD